MFDCIWKSSAPSKVVAFSWKLLLDRIPTRVNFQRWNIFPPDASSLCVFCGRRDEFANHLFIHCEKVIDIWYKVIMWLEICFINPSNLFVHWECWSLEGRNKRIWKGLRLIWHAKIWAIWQTRNQIIFKNEVSAVKDIVQAVKVLS